MLKKLILTNWKSHKNNIIEFNKGYNLFVGNIGSGKTSIFDAIVFALFGSTPNINSRKILAKDVIMSKPLDENEAIVILEFEIETNIYKVERTIFKNKSSQAKLYLNDKLIRGPKPSDVNEEIENILKINIDLFMKANYAEQNSIDYFLKMPANERKNLFDNIFGISKYDNYANNAKQTHNKLKIKYEDLLIKKTEYENLASNYNLIDINKKIKDLKENCMNINLDLNKSENKLKELKEKEQIIFKEKSNFENNTNSLNNLLGKQNYLEKIISEIKLDYNLEELNTKIENLKELENKLKSEYNIIEEELNNLKNKSYFYKNKLIEINNKKTEFLKLKELLINIPEDINNIVNKLVSKIDEKKEDFSKINEEIKSIEQELNILSKEHSNCPLCNSELSSNHKTEIITKKTNTINTLKTNLKEIIITINELKQDYELKNKQREFYNKNIEYFKILKNESLDEDNYTKLLTNNLNLENKYSEKQIDLKTKKEEISEKLLELNNIKTKINDFDIKQKDLKDIKTKITELKDNLKSINYLPEDYLKNKEDLQKIISETIFKKELKTEKEKQIKEEEFKLEQYNKINEKQILNNKELEILKHFLEDLIIYSNIAKKTQEQIREQIVSSVNEIFMDLWQNIYPYKDFQKVKFNISEGDYKIELEFDKEYKRELDEFVSGGERSAIALTLRIAMSLVMKNKLNLIVLDEPTHNLDKLTVLKLSELFNNYLPQFIDQIFVITHDNTLEENAQNVFYIQRNKEEDSPSEIRIK
jgi:exonuclease SbcC